MGKVYIYIYIYIAHTIKVGGLMIIGLTSKRFVGIEVPNLNFAMVST